MKKDIILTLITQFLILFSLLIGYKLALYFFGDDGFSEYSLSKRNIALLASILSFGMATAITRYIAVSDKNHIEKNNFFTASLFILIVVIIISSFTVYIMQEEISFIFYGSKKYIDSILPIYISIIGILFHVEVYSYYRGIIKIKISNIIEITNMAIIPIISFFIAKDINQLFIITGVMQIIFSVIVLVIIYRGLDNLEFNFNVILPSAKKLIHYGVQRLPSDIGLNLLLTLPALMVTHSMGVKIGGMVAFSITVLAIIGYVFSPFGVVLLPRISKMIKDDEIYDLKLIVLKLLGFTIGLTLLIVGISSISLDFVLKIYLGDVDPQLIEICYLILYGAFGYTIFLVMRGVLDAIYTKGINSFNVIFSIIFFLLIVEGRKYILGENSYIDYIIILNYTMSLLALLTLYWVYRGIKQDV